MQNVVFQNIECKTIYIYILVIHFRKAEEENEKSAESETPTDKGNVEGVPSLKNGIACCGPLSYCQFFRMFTLLSDIFDTVWLRHYIDRQPCCIISILELTTIHKRTNSYSKCMVHPLPYLIGHIPCIH